MDRAKQARYYALFATLLWLGVFVLELLYHFYCAKVVHEPIKEYMKPGTIYMLVLMLAIPVAIFLEKKLALAVAVGLYSLFLFYDFIGIQSTMEYSTYYYVQTWKFDRFPFFRFVPIFLLLLLIVLAVLKRKLPTWVWWIPGCVWAANQLATIAELIKMNKRTWVSSTYRLIAVRYSSWMVYAVALVFLGLWLKNSTLAAIESSETNRDAGNAEPTRDKKTTHMTLAGCALMYAAILVGMMVYFYAARDLAKMNDFTSFAQRQTENVVSFNSFFFRNFLTSRSSYGYLLCAGAVLTAFSRMQKKLPDEIEMEKTEAEETETEEIETEEIETEEIETEEEDD